ncbi:MAG: hypothetical protein WC451_03105 [Patescibacteria group bacterium]|jgi:hypothetical protein
MKTLEELQSVFKDLGARWEADGLNIIFSTCGVDYHFIASWGEGWDHVSVSILHKKRMPTWGEMCMVKDLFWNPEETVIQYHPAKSSYVNVHPWTLHLWQPHNLEIPVPRTWLV